MAIRLTASSSQYLVRTTDVVNHNADYTIMAWFYPTLMNSQFRYLFYMDASAGGNSDLMSISNSNLLQIEVNWAGATGGTALSANVWYHLALRRTGNTLHGILNGAIIATKTLDISARAATTSMYLSSRRGGSVFYDGYVAACKIWQASLSLGEIVNERAYTMPRRFQSLYAWYPMLPGNGRALDASGYNRRWTENGSPTNAETPPIRWITAPIIVSAPPAASGVTATAAATLAAFTVSSAANTTNTATGSATLAAFTSTSAATMTVATITATASATLDALTSTSAATMTVATITATATATLDAITVSSAANTTNTATASTTLADLTSTSAASLGALATITAAATATLAAVTVTSTATLTIVATASATLADIAYVPRVVITHYRSTQLLLFPYQASYELLWAYEATYEVLVT